MWKIGLHLLESINPEQVPEEITDIHRKNAWLIEKSLEFRSRLDSWRVNNKTWIRPLEEQDRGPFLSHDILWQMSYALDCEDFGLWTKKRAFNCLNKYDHMLYYLFK